MPSAKRKEVETLYRPSLFSPCSIEFVKGLLTKQSGLRSSTHFRSGPVGTAATSRRETHSSFSPCVGATSAALNVQTAGLISGID